MPDTRNTKSILSLVATTSSKIKNLVIKDGQLIFLQDLGRIAFDFKGKRVFYNQIAELNTEAERLTLESPLSGYYFVIDTAVLWFYQNEWVQITEKPQEVIYIGVELPELGQANKIYANTTSGNEHISVWDAERGEYVVVADRTHDVTVEDIEKLFN